MATKRARTAWDSAESARREQNHSDILKNVGISSTGGRGLITGWGMQTTKSVIRRPGARTKRLERIVKGFANHRRIEILELLERHPEMCVSEISEKLQIEMKTASEHLRRLAIAGLLLKRYEGREVRHAITEQARHILSFLDKLA